MCICLLDGLCIQGHSLFVKTVEVATHYPIAQHIEMSFLPAPPAQLYFGCLKPSASSGGETALADFRRVFADLPTDLKLKFLDKGIRYTRTHKKVGSYYTYDVSDMLGWPELFGTDSKEEVEKICKSEGIPFEWHGDTFVSTTQSPAFQLHPVTKEHVWFNHTQVFHWTTFPAELWFAFKRTWEVRLLLHCILVGIFCIIKYGILGHKMSLNSTFGDGTPITAQEMGQIRKAIHDNMVFSRWQKGDIMMIDNFSTSHGRQPTYDSGRKIAVSWSDPIVKKNEVVSLDPVLVQEEEVCMENPQEKTPESTLTKSDLATLQEQMQAKELGEKLLGHLAKRCEANSQDDFSTADLKGLFHKIEQRKMHSRSYSQPPAFYY